MADTFGLHKYIVSATDRDSVFTTLSVWINHPSLRPGLEESNVFDTPEAAHARVAHLKQSAEEDGQCEPGHECGRCVDWNPRVWEIHIEIEEHTG